MRLVTLDTLAKRISPDRAISAPTLRRWINTGNWPKHAATKRGKRWFVDLDKLEHENNLVDFLTDGAEKTKR